MISSIICFALFCISYLVPYDYVFLLKQSNLMVVLADNWQELVQKIKSKGMRPGVALKPGTPIEEVYPLV